jgi:hypothetical protein
MTWIIALAILWFVFGRWSGRMWSGRACLGQVHGGRGRWGAGRWTRPSDHLMFASTRVRPSAAGTLEALQRRYVAGDLTDEQYEQELDVLFRRASGRHQA